MIQALHASPCLYGYSVTFNRCIPYSICMGLQTNEASLYSRAHGTGTRVTHFGSVPRPFGVGYIGCSVGARNIKS